MTKAYISFGGNLGDPASAYREIARALVTTPGVSQIRASKLITTTPVGGPANQPPFCNGCYEIETTKSASETLDICQILELQFGRERKVFWDARTVDLDIVLFGMQVIQTDRLVVPHPRLAYRRFVLAPLVELAPHVTHPVIGAPAQALLTSIDLRPLVVGVVGGDVTCVDRLRRAGEDVLPGVQLLSVSGSRWTPVRASPDGPVLAARLRPSEDVGFSWIVMMDEGSADADLGGPTSTWPVFDCRQPFATPEENWRLFLHSIT